jgi:hypothetical protein
MQRGGDERQADQHEDLARNGMLRREGEPTSV